MIMGGDGGLLRCGVLVPEHDNPINTIKMLFRIPQVNHALLPGGDDIENPGRKLNKERLGRGVKLVLSLNWLGS